MKRSLALMACVLSSAMVLTAVSPVMAADKEKTETADTKEDAGTEETKKDSDTESTALEDGIYSAEFDTDSNMFHVNEANDGKGTLTVKDGKMTIHVSLVSKSIVNLFVGTAEDAKKDGAELLEPTTDTVTYSDGMSEEVYGFDIPVPAIDEEFNVALIGKKNKWYDHKVVVSDPVTEDSEGGVAPFDLSTVEDGSYTIELTMEGGSGRASIQSPTQITVADGAATATLEWSSPNYDYMKVGEEKFLPVNQGGETSMFEIPVTVFDRKMAVSADTTAMSTPHEIEYTLQFDSASIKAE